MGFRWYIPLPGPVVWTPSQGQKKQRKMTAGEAKRHGKAARKLAETFEKRAVEYIDRAIAAEERGDVKKAQKLELKSQDFERLAIQAEARADEAFAYAEQIRLGG